MFKFKNRQERKIRAMYEDFCNLEAFRQHCDDIGLLQNKDFLEGQVAWIKNDQEVVGYFASLRRLYDYLEQHKHSAPPQGAEYAKVCMGSINTMLEEILNCRKDLTMNDCLQSGVSVLTPTDGNENRSLLVMLDCYRFRSTETGEFEFV